MSDVHEVSLRDLTADEMLQLVHAITDPLLQAYVTFLILGDEISAAVLEDMKPMNAFVAFRSFYICIPELSDIPMSKCSGVISTLWKDCIQRGWVKEWYLISETWSKIRDQIGKDTAPLYPFLSIACQHLNLIEPKDYLDATGYEIVFNQEGDPMAIHTKATVTQENTGAKDMVSVDQLIAHCQSMGYAREYNGASSPLMCWVTGGTQLGGTVFSTQQQPGGELNAIMRDAAVLHQYALLQNGMQAQGPPSEAQSFWSGWAANNNGMTSVERHHQETVTPRSSAFSNDEYPFNEYVNWNMSQNQN